MVQVAFMSLNYFIYFFCSVNRFQFKLFDTQKSLMKIFSGNTRIINKNWFVFPIPNWFSVFQLWAAELEWSRSVICHNFWINGLFSYVVKLFVLSKYLVALMLYYTKFVSCLICSAFKIEFVAPAINYCVLRIENKQVVKLSRTLFNRDVNKKWQWHDLLFCTFFHLI